MRQAKFEDLAIDELRGMYRAQNPFVTSPTVDYALIRIDRLERAFRRIEREIPEFIGAEGRLKSRPDVTEAEDTEEETLSSHGGRVLRRGDPDHFSPLVAGWRASPPLRDHLGGSLH